MNRGKAFFFGCTKTEKKMPNIGFVAKIKNDVSQGFLGNVTL